MAMVKNLRVLTDPLELQLRRLILDKDNFLADLEPALSGILKDPHAEARINLLRHVSAFDEAIMDGIVFLIVGTWDGERASHWWQSMLAAKLIKRSFRRGLFETYEHSIDLPLVAKHLDDGTFGNLFLPATELHNRYGALTVSLDVRLPSGDFSRGSGFLTGAVFPKQGAALPLRRVLVTCRHNIEGNTLQAATTGRQVVLDLPEPYFSRDHDIALYDVGVTLSDFPIALGEDADVFDEAFTIGFPYVPRAHGALLGHKGEVNGFAQRYIEGDQVMLISNLVSPGSSGCPVLDRTGRCIGMTTNWLEAEYGEERARFSAAIPVSTIRTEIEAAGMSWW